MQSNGQAFQAGTQEIKTLPVFLGDPRFDLSLIVGGHRRRIRSCLLQS